MSRDEQSHDELPAEHPRRRRRRSRSARFPVARFGIATVCVGLWAASYLRAIFDASYHPPAGIGGVALAAATYLFGSGLLRSREDDDE